MSYDPRPNASGDTLVSSRDPIRTNFELIKSRFDENHVAIDGGSGGGKHNFMQMPEQASAPSTAANEGGLYAKVGTAPAETNLFFRGESSGYEYQLTKTITASTATFGTNAAYGSPPATFSQVGGWTFLPGGLIMQYGLFSKTGALGASGTIALPITFPTAIYNVTVSLFRISSGNQSLSTNTLTTTNFKFLSSSAGSDGIYWHAIGN